MYIPSQMALILGNPLYYDYYYYYYSVSVKKKKANKRSI